MRGDRVDLARAGVEDGLRAGRERAAGVDDVVDDHRAPALDLLLADHVADLCDLLGGAVLLEQCVVDADVLGELPGELHAAGVRSDDYQVPGVVAELVLHELGEDRHGGHVVDRLREEALQLAGVEVHGHEAIDSDRLERLCHDPRRDRLARR